MKTFEGVLNGPTIELEAEEMDRLRRILAAPGDDIEELVKITEVKSPDEFLAFMDTLGLWEDPEYVEIATKVLTVLGVSDAEGLISARSRDWARMKTMHQAMQASCTMDS